MRRRQNWIEGIEDSNGTWQSETEKIHEEFERYFKEIFTFSRPDQRMITSVLSHVPRKFTDEMNHMLLAPFNREEITAAIKSFPPTKAPGRDGFPAIFF